MTTCALVGFCTVLANVVLCSALLPKQPKLTTGHLAGNYHGQIVLLFALGSFYLAALTDATLT